MKREQGAPGRGLTATGRLALVAMVSVVQLTSPDGVFLRDAKSRDLFNSARIAVFGGPGGIARLKGLRLKGRSRFPSNEGALVSAAVEVRVLLPDRYLRIDTGPFGRRLTGYSVNEPLNVIENSNGQITRDSGDAADIVRSNRAYLARLMLGAATFTSPEMPMKFQTGGTPADMPGPSEPLGIDAVGDDGFRVRLVFDGKTHLPVRVVFFSFAHTVWTTTFADRRSIGGMQAPYRIVTTEGDRLVDELLFDEVEVNPRLSKADFVR